MELDLILSTNQLGVLRPSVSILYPDDSSYVICEVIVVTTNSIIDATTPPVNLSKLDLELGVMSTIYGQVR